jgi:hypothetical protein
MAGPGCIQSSREAGLNKAIKLVMLEFAFEVLKVNRVEQKTDLINLQSQKAMTKLGAYREGFSSALRHLERKDPDSVYFSYILEEWPAIKAQYFRPLTYSSLHPSRKIPFARFFRKLATFCNRNVVITAYNIAKVL